MAKNYTWGWMLKQKGLVEVPESEYTNRQQNDKEFIDKLSAIVKEANCGWNGVAYKLMKYSDNNFEKYMVLYVDVVDNGRWIPITGNSKGCNLAVLGENLL